MEDRGSVWRWKGAALAPQQGRKGATEKGVVPDGKLERNKSAWG